MRNMIFYCKQSRGRGRISGCKEGFFHVFLRFGFDFFSKPFAF